MISERLRGLGRSEGLRQDFRRFPPFVAMRRFCDKKSQATADTVCFLSELSIDKLPQYSQLSLGTFFHYGSYMGSFRVSITPHTLMCFDRLQHLGVYG